MSPCTCGAGPHHPSYLLRTLQLHGWSERTALRILGEVS